MTTTYATDRRPTYTGPRTKWTKPDGIYLLQICVPTAGRTFLFDDSENGPAAEFTRHTGLSPRGMVGSAAGESAFMFDASFVAENDHEAVAMANDWRAAYGRTLSVRVLYWQPNEFGASSELVATLV